MNQKRFRSLCNRAKKIVRALRTELKGSEVEGKLANLAALLEALSKKYFNDPPGRWHINLETLIKIVQILRWIVESWLHNRG